jgi:hypothetical protein
MERISNIRTYAAVGFMAVSALTLCTACDNDDDVVKAQLASPEITLVDSTATSLTFSWSSVDQAYQYEYELRDSREVLVEGNLTDKNSVTIEGLNPETEYTLSVVAYAQDVRYYLASESATLSAKTDVAPIVASELWRAEGTFTSTDLGDSWTATLVAYDDNHYELLSWYGVEGYNLQFYVTADGGLDLSNYESSYGYYYVPTGRSDYEQAALYVADGYSGFSGDETKGSIFVWDYLAAGGYDKFTWGTTNEPETPSDTDRTALWSADGTYTCAVLATSWKATLTAYSDGSYTLASWFGVEGYDFTFSLTADSVLTANYSLDEFQYYCVPTGRTDYPTAYLYFENQCSSFTGDATQGVFFLYDYLTQGGYDTFTWSASASSNSSSLTLASLVGSYSEHTTGYWNATCDYTCDVTLAIEDEATQSVSLNGFSGSATPLVGTVDLEARTITFEPNQDFASYYLFSAEADQYTSVIATIADDGTITLKDWGAWYPWQGVYYTYAYGMVSVLTKQ